MTDRPPTHIAIPVDVADQVIALLQDVPTRWGHPIMARLERAIAITIDQDEAKEG